MRRGQSDEGDFDGQPAGGGKEERRHLGDGGAEAAAGVGLQRLLVGEAAEFAAEGGEGGHDVPCGGQT